VTTKLESLPRSEVVAQPSGSDGASPPGRLIGRAWTSHGASDLATVEDAQRAIADPTTRVWVDVEDASQEMLQALAACLDLHPIVVEDIIERNQRAKVVYTGETMHLVMFALSYGDVLTTSEIDIVLGHRFLLTSHPPEWRPAEQINLKRVGVDHYLKIGTDFMLYAVIDPMVDSYFPVMDRLGDEIDGLEDEVVRRGDRAIVERLFDLRRSLLEVRHTISPERELFNQLTNREDPLIARERIIYFRDIYDHLIRITDELDSYRELVSGALEAYLSTINNNLSEIMKRLTAITAILAGIAAIGGIFGMSEAPGAFALTEGVGFWIVAGLTVLLGVGMLAYFRRIGWL